MSPRPPVRAMNLATDVKTHALYILIVLMRILSQAHTRILKIVKRMQARIFCNESANFIMRNKKTIYCTLTVLQENGNTIIMG